MDKIKKINDFLRLIAEISKNGIIIEPNLVYSNLIRMGTNRKSIENYFTPWQERFAKTHNIDVFVSPSWKYFCQFIGKGSKTSDNEKLKMYIPLDEAHIYEGVNKIFDFTSKNNIPHLSKVAKHTRFDDVVLQVDNYKDADIIRQFVSNDEYIKEGLIEPNPFAITDGMISFAWNGDLSYNTVVSEWISEYINSMKNNLDFVSYSSFFEYVSRRYKQVFQNGDDINSFYIGRDIDNTREDLANYQRVTELLLISLRRESKLLDLYKFHEFVRSPKSKEEVLENISRLQRKDAKEIAEISKESKEAFDYAFLKHSKKDGVKTAIDRFKQFAKEGDYRVFTRSDGVRILMQETLDKPLAIRFIYQEEKQALIDASLETAKKYDTTQLARALFGIKNNDYKSFTNTNNARERLKLWIQPGEINALIHNTLIDEGYKDINEDEEYWIFIEMISKLRKIK